MDADEFADASSRSRPGVGRGLNRGNITTDDRSYKSGADLFVADQLTFAALTIASAASIVATSPLVSTIPNASCI